jgi:subtilisin family serine protease
VQTISPARAGGYRNPPSGTATGAVVTVSAVKSRKLTGGNWRDIFWKFSAYGNGDITPTTPPRQMGPPDFAAPGVRIRSLWPPSSDNPKGQTNVCSGTSFAAAHVSGLLAYGIPNTDQLAKFDPSALRPGKPPDSNIASDYADAFRDPIAHR